MSSRSAHAIAAAGLLASAVVLALIAVRSRGVLLDDELGHLLIARDAWSAPRLVFDAWGRTVHTLLFMPTAPFPLAWARMEAIVLSVGTMLLAWRSARKLDIPLAPVVPLLVLLQTWELEAGWMAITEVPFGLLATLATWCAVSRRWGAAGVVMGLLPLVRHEGIVLAAFFAVIAAARRRWLAVVLTAAPLLVVNLVALVVYRYLPMAVYLHPNASAEYGTGPLWTLPLASIRGATIPCVVLAAVGVASAAAGSALTWIAVGHGLYLCTHAILYRLGLYATGGYDVFLLPMAPGLAVLAASGLAEVCRRVRAGPAARVALVATALAAMLLEARAFPRTRLWPRDVEMRHAVTYLQDHHVDPADVVAADVWLFYYLPKRIDPERSWALPQALDRLPAGTVAVWESKYADAAGLPRAVLDAPGSGWHRLWSEGAHVVVYVRSAAPGLTPGRLSAAAGCAAGRWPAGPAGSRPRPPARGRPPPGSAAPPRRRPMRRR